MFHTKQLALSAFKGAFLLCLLTHCPGARGHPCVSSNAPDTQTPGALGDGPRQFAARVVAGERKQVIRSARVSLYEVPETMFTNSRRASKRRLVRVLNSDDTGGFSCSLAALKHPHVQVEADGYALAIMAVTPTPAGQPTEIALVAGERCCIDVRDLSPDAPRELRVQARLELFQVPESGLVLSGDTDLAGLKWEVVTNNDLAVIENIPLGSSLSIALVDSTRIIWRTRELIELDHNEDRTIVVDLAKLKTVGVEVRDQDSQPVQDAVLWVFPTGNRNSKYFQESDRPGWTLRTNHEGKAMISDIVPGLYLIGPAPDPLRTANEFACHGSIMEVAEESSRQEIAVTCYRNQWISGSVVDDRGRGIVGITVTALSLDSQGFRFAKTRSGGQFVVGPLAGGGHVVWAMDDREDEWDSIGGWFNESIKLRMAPGVADAVLVVPQGR